MKSLFKIAAIVLVLVFAACNEDVLPTKDDNTDAPTPMAAEVTPTTMAGEPTPTN